MTQRVTAIVRGRVQGVCYRDNTQRVAIGLGLVGTVRNLPSGAVEIIAEGERSQLDTLLTWARQGPARARVDHLSETFGPATGAFSDFRVTG